MPPTIFARPVLPTEATTAPANSGWAHSVDTVTTWAHTTPTWAWTIPLAALLALSIRGRRKRAKVEKTGAQKAAITRTDRAITRTTGLIATAVLAQGMWVFFTDVLHLPPVLRLVLFAFVEFQIISTWRRALRTLHRHGHLGSAVRSVYLLAFGSALIASWHAATAQLGGFRWFVAFVAAYMIVEELVEERDIFLTANPTYKTNPKTARANRRINWAITPERVLVWLRLAEPAERQVGDVDRSRRIARFARTAYRLHLLTETAAAKWRIRAASRSLRRQAEAANEHLSLSTDRAAMDRVRAHLAFLYQVESGTSRTAVADLSPFRPAPQLAISAQAYRTPGPDSVRNPAGQVRDTRADTDTTGHRTPAPDSGQTSAGDTPADGGAPPNPTPRQTPRRTPAPTPKWSPAQLKAFRLRDRDGRTYPEIAAQLDVSDKTVSRWFKAREAANDAKERPLVATFALPKPPVTAGANGHPFPAQEVS